MDTIHSVIAEQDAQEHISRAQAERLAKESRQVRARTRSRRRALRLFRRPDVANAAPRR